jgi:hypothetical protein
MIDSVPLIQNANDAQQINASIIAMKKASRELDEKIVKLNSLNSELDKKIALLDSGLNKEIEDRKEAIKSLDVSSVGGSGKYISAISETDGKISATASDITSSVSSGNSQPVTSGGVADAIGKIIYDGTITDCNNAWQKGKTVTYFVQGILNVPNNNNGWYLMAQCQPANLSANNYVTQIATPSTNNNVNDVYTRHAYLGGGTMTWTSWTRLIKDTDIVNTVASGNSNPVTSNAVYAEFQKRNPVIIATMQNNTANIKYFKISYILADVRWGDAVYLLEAREGELLLISVGHGDNAIVAPKVKRLADVYSKISGIAYKSDSRNLYVKILAWSHEIVLTRLTSFGMTDPDLSLVQEITATEYSSATEVTISS